LPPSSAVPVPRHSLPRRANFQGASASQHGDSTGGLVRHGNTHTNAGQTGAKRCVSRRDAPLQCALGAETGISSARTAARICSLWLTVLPPLLGASCCHCCCCCCYCSARARDRGASAQGSQTCSEGQARAHRVGGRRGGNQRIQQQTKIQKSASNRSDSIAMRWRHGKV